MNKQGKPKILITGASSGIGKELAKTFAIKGHPLVLVARNEKKLSLVATEIRHKYNVPCSIILQDLAIPGAAQELFHKLQQDHPDISVLINNAGIGLLGEFATSNIAQIEQTIHLNILSLTVLTRLFLEKIQQTNKGHIINIASVAAFVPGPLMSVYFASKHYVLAFSQGLARELKDSQIYVTCVCPGPTQTDFFKREGNTLKLSPKEEIVMMSPKRVAQKTYRAYRNGKFLLIPGSSNKALSLLGKILPSSLMSEMMFLIYSRQYKKSFKE